MNYKEWEKLVPEAITADSLWKMAAYRLALFLADVGWEHFSFGADLTPRPPLRCGEGG